jgi:hypothetical protein
MLKVFTAMNPVDAHLAQGILETEGIPSEVRNVALFSTLDGGPSAYGMQPSVWIVDDGQLAQARQLLAGFLHGQGVGQGQGPGWNCPGCGEALEGQFTSCWQCGQERPQALP